MSNKSFILGKLESDLYRQFSVLVSASDLTFGIVLDGFHCNVNDFWFHKLKLIVLK